jgi:hypothetical protein
MFRLRCHHFGILCRASTGPSNAVLFPRYGLQQLEGYHGDVERQLFEDLRTGRSQHVRALLCPDRSYLQRTLDLVAPQYIPGNRLHLKLPSWFSACASLALYKRSNLSLFANLARTNDNQTY